MGFSIELAFDEGSTELIRALWEGLQSLYGTPHTSELGVAPHVSLASFPDGQPDFAESVVEELSAAFAPLVLDFSNVGHFASEEAVVYLQPEPSVELRKAHIALHRLLETRGETGSALYRPGRWIPHCTVATDVPKDKLRQVLHASQESDALGPVTVTSIIGVSYAPATELYRYPLLGQEP